MTEHYDVIVIGGGMAGASAAWSICEHASLAILEAEDHAGLHSTGRSAAFYAETYGGRHVQPLTTASKAFLFDPPAGFADAPLVSPRGALHVAAAGNAHRIDALAAEFSESGVTVEWLDDDRTAAFAPMLADGWRRRSLYEPDCKDIDVARLHQAFLAGCRKRGAVVHCGAEVRGAVRTRGQWRLSTPRGEFSAPVIVNAAGAWADTVAGLAGVGRLGIQPMLRTMVVADVGAPVKTDMPLVVDAAGTLYFKPDAGQLWISPHDETPCAAADVRPREIDIAIAVDRFERATTVNVRRVVRAWAGLRSFAPDRLPVYGFAPGAAGFFWCAGQGGFGIQTAPAAGRLTAALVLGAGTVDPGVDPDRYAPTRDFRVGGTA